jgi:hypothetical protein
MMVRLEVVGMFPAFERRGERIQDSGIRRG